MRLDAEFPSGPVTSVALTPGGNGVVWMWALVEAALWRCELNLEGEIREVRRVEIPHRSREILPVDLIANLPDVELAIVYPNSLSLLRAPPTDSFREVLS